jgi:hypothetical protein
MPHIKTRQNDELPKSVADVGGESPRQELLTGIRGLAELSLRTSITLLAPT